MILLLSLSLLVGDAKAESKALYQEANAAYTLGKFDDALAKYSKAYELFPAPEFLFNIGQCHKNLRNHDRAIFFFQGFLRQKPNTPNRKLVEELIQQSEHEQERATRAEAVRQRQILASSMPVRALQPDAQLADATPMYKQGWFWGAVGGGVAAAAIITTLLVVLVPRQATAADWTLDLRRQ